MKENVRLIDANELIKCLDYCAWNDAVEVVEQQPTAYDVEKVVEQLEDKLTCEDFGTCGYCQNRWCPRELLDADDAIEIVRKGGIE